jgi:two-component system, NtrC family, response regulator AtoC
MEIGKIPQAANKSAPLRILVVDDESLIRWSLAETLSDLGHLVSEAGDGEAALGTLTHAGGSFDVVLLDYHLPDSHDLVLLAEIRRLAPNAMVIMMTAFATPEMSDAALRIGACRVVPKPFDIHVMADLVLEAYTAARSH